MTTNKEQGRRLLAAGVSADTADMFEQGGVVYHLPRGVNYLHFELVMTESWQTVRPVWSLARLCELAGASRRVAAGGIEAAVEAVIANMNK